MIAYLLVTRNLIDKVGSVFGEIREGQQRRFGVYWMEANVTQIPEHGITSLWRNEGAPFQRFVWKN